METICEYNNHQISNYKLATVQRIDAILQDNITITRKEKPATRKQQDNTSTLSYGPNNRDIEFQLCLGSSQNVWIEFGWF